MNTIQDFLKQRLNGKSVRGLTLRNANGDIDQSTFGYQIAIDTLTFIKKQVTEQKFYEVAPADYVPIAVGDGAFMQNILTNLSFNTSGDFEEGVINQGVANDRLAVAGAAVSSKTVKVINWAKAVNYTIFEIEQALQANNWDYIEQLHKARKKNFDLGIQQIAFLGSASDSNVKGLLNQSNVNVNLSLINEPISTMDTTEFAALVTGLIEAYQANCSYTAYPTHWVIPQSDYNGLMAPVSKDYPFNSKLEYLQNMFKALVPGGVKILPLVYAQASFNASRGIDNDRYMLYRYDAESIRMDIPVNFTPTQANTVNNFQFQDAAYAQYTGVAVYRELEALYFDID